MGEILLKLAVFGIFGLGLEVICTSVYAFFSKESVFSGNLNRRSYLLGYSSMWYIPLYALAWPFLIIIHNYLPLIPWLLKGIIYAIFCHIIEYLGMGILRKILGKSPSEDNYKTSRFTIHGLTDLRLFPWFFIAGFSFEWLYFHIA